MSLANNNSDPASTVVPSHTTRDVNAMNLQSLQTLFQEASKPLRRDAFASIVVFPRTSLLTEDKPRMVVKSDKKPDYDAILRQVQENPEMIALSAREDLAIILLMLKELHDELFLAQFDSIQIYRGGVDLLRIDLRTANLVDRSAYVEINEYRRRLQQYGRPEANLPVFVAGLVVGFVSILAAKVIQQY